MKRAVIVAVLLAGCAGTMRSESPAEPTIEEREAELERAAADCARSSGSTPPCTMAKRFCASRWPNARLQRSAQASESSIAFWISSRGDGSAGHSSNCMMMSAPI